NGEVDIWSSDPKDRAGGSRLRVGLEQNNYEVRGLRLSPIKVEGSENPRDRTGTAVPDDAAVVVVAAPRSVLPGYVLAALRDYMNPKDAGKKKGKLIVLTDVQPGPDGRMVDTGLERFVGEFNVEVGNDRILALSVKSVLESDGAVRYHARSPEVIRL